MNKALKYMHTKSIMLVQYLLVCFLIVCIEPGILATEKNVGNLSNSQLQLESLGRYYLSVDAVRAIEARYRCESLGGKLLTMQTNDDVKSLQERLSMELKGKQYWIGGKLLEDDFCFHKPFNISCWYWDVEEENYDFYNSTLIQFTEWTIEATLQPSSYILILVGEKLELESDHGAEMYPFICDFKPKKTNNVYV